MTYVFGKIVFRKSQTPQIMIISFSGNVGQNLLQRGQFFVLWSSVLQDFVVSLCLSSGEAVRCTNHLLPLLSFISVLPATNSNNLF